MIRTHKMALTLSLCALGLVAAVPAATASPAQQGYDETTVLGNVDEGGPAATQETSSPTPTSNPQGDTAPVAAESVQPVETAPTATTEASLPFTGADLGILAAIGVLLGVTGLVLHRVVRQRPAA